MYYQNSELTHIHGAAREKNCVLYTNYCQEFSAEIIKFKNVILYYIRQKNYFEFRKCYSEMRLIMLKIYLICGRF